MEKSVVPFADELLIIGGSAGSLDVLLQVLPELRVPVSKAIIIVVHRKNINDLILTELLSAKTTVPVKEAEEKDPIQQNIIYIVPPDYHLLIENDKTFSLDVSEKVNYSRPSIDVTFTSAAEVFGNKLTCILLSGANADGVEGLKAAKRNGGTIIVQHPDSAEIPYMPLQAIKAIEADYVLNDEELKNYFARLNV